MNAVRMFVIVFMMFDVLPKELSDFPKGHNEKELLPIMKEKFFICSCLLKVPGIRTDLQ